MEEIKIIYLYLSEIVALCGGKKPEDGACNIPYQNDSIIYRGGLSRNSVNI
jgi:hypothetical protein